MEPQALRDAEVVQTEVQRGLENGVLSGEFRAGFPVEVVLELGFER